MKNSIIEPSKNRSKSLAYISTVSNLLSKPFTFINIPFSRLRLQVNYCNNNEGSCQKANAGPSQFFVTGLSAIIFCFFQSTFTFSIRS